MGSQTTDGVDRLSYIKNEQCEDWNRLSEALKRAVEASYAANINLLAAQKEKRETAPHAIALVKARAAEFDAISALEKHRTDHGC